MAWQLVWYGGGASPLEGTQISPDFRDDGTLTGIAGCNSYFADYEIDGDQFVIGAIAPTGGAIEWIRVVLMGSYRSSWKAGCEPLVGQHLPVLGVEL